MPYRLEKGPHGGYKVVTSTTGKPHSNHELSHAQAVAQLRALYANVPDAKKGK